MNTFEKLPQSFKELYNAQLSKDGDSIILFLQSGNGLISISNDAVMEETACSYSFRKVGQYWIHAMKEYNNINLNLF